jgi:hypothetical protein
LHFARSLGRRYCTFTRSLVHPHTRRDTSLVTNMEMLFYFKMNFKDDISLWDVSRVTTMEAMFQNAFEFNANIGGWVTSQVKNMGSMFFGARAFNQAIGSWDVSRVINMQQMFNSAIAFDQDLSTWCVKKIQDKPYSFDSYNTKGFKNPFWCTCNDGKQCTTTVKANANCCSLNDNNIHAAVDHYTSTDQNTRQQAIGSYGPISQW